MRSHLSTPATPVADPRDGFGLVEVLVCVVVMGIVSVPFSAFIVQTVRATLTAERSATTTGLVTAAAALVVHLDVDPCDPVALRAALVERLDLPDGYTVDVVADCTTPGVALVAVEMTDPTGAAREYLASREWPMAVAP